MKQHMVIIKGTKASGCAILNAINSILDKYQSIKFEIFTTPLIPKEAVVFTEYENMFFE